MAQTAFTLAQVLSLTDALTEHYDALAAALDGAKAKADLYLSRLQTYADPLSFANMARNGLDYDNSSPSSAWFGGQMRRIIRDLETQVAVTNQPVSSTIVSLDTYATYQNGLTPYSCLFSWEFALLYYLSQNKQLSPANVYSPGGPVGTTLIIPALPALPYYATVITLPNGQNYNVVTGYQLCHGAIVSGAPTFAADNGGAIPLANSLSPLVQGVSPVNPQLLITTNMAGSAGATLVFSGFNQTGAAKTWTGTVVSGGGAGAAAGTVVALTPQTAGDRMTQVSAVALGAGATLTAGAWQMRVAQEAGRPN